jgi:hypothetical protein
MTRKHAHNTAPSSNNDNIGGPSRQSGGMRLGLWDHKPGDPERYGCRDVTTREDVRLSEVNQPSTYAELPDEEKAVLQEWIRAELAPSSEVGPHASYRLKHILQRLEGLYVTNGEWKGAMLVAGYQPIDRMELNWQFRFTCDPELMNRSLGRGAGEAA